MMNLDFSTKELVDSYIYSTAKQNRVATKTFNHNGRWYTKFGENQVVTFAGFVYRVDNELKQTKENVLVIGMSKQSPYETHINKQVATEVAAEKALTEPMTVMVIPEDFNKHDFHDMMELYVSKMSLQLMKTAKEIASEKPKDRNGVGF